MQMTVELVMSPLLRHVHTYLACTSRVQPVDEDVCKQAVHAAFNAGINFFDTSPFYGNTKSETVMRIHGALSTLV